jgi:hypothetical protein
LGLVGDDVAQHGAIAVADGHLERDGLGDGVHQFAHLLGMQFRALGDLVDGRFTPQLLLQKRGRLTHLLERLCHVLGDPNQRRLLLERTGDGVADPPCGVGAEATAATGVEMLRCMEQPEVAFLNQVDHRQPAPV